jgi:hypothetical protein
MMSTQIAQACTRSEAAEGQDYHPSTTQPWCHCHPDQTVNKKHTEYPPTLAQQHAS